MPTTILTPPLRGTQSQKWQDAAAYLVQHAEHIIFSPKGKEALDYLRSLGLTDETIKHFHLGYMPQSQQFSFADWGIDPSTLTEKQRSKGGINIPDGILIPWYVDGQIWKLTVKRPGKTPEYGQIVGSQECLFNCDSIQTDEPAIMVESELDAMSMWEQTGIAVVATGGEKKCRIARWLADLSLARVILQAFDHDEHADYWTGILRNCLRWHIDKSMSLQDQINSLTTLSRDNTQQHENLPFKFDQERALPNKSIDLPTLENTPSKSYLLSATGAMGMCEICRFNQAFVIWKFGKRYCAYCRDHENRKSQ